MLSLLIFLIAPFGRALRDGVSGVWGHDSFLYGSAALVLLVLALALWQYLRSPHRSLSGAAVLIGVSGVYSYLIYSAKSGSPVEAVHYVLYGVLGVLLYRALVHHVHDYSIHVLALLIGTMVGILDEVIQWAAPDRHFDTRDIWMNLTGVGLVQIAVAFGIRPPLIAVLPDHTALSRVSYSAALLAGMLMLCHLNTPATVGAYVKHIPALGFLTKEDDAMIEYGHLHANPNVGSFKSRLTIEGLQQMDASIGAAAPPEPFEDPTWEGFQSFIKSHPGYLHPFLHEARVHIRSRDVNLKRAEGSTDPTQAQVYYTYAYREHQILKKYFTALYANSDHHWPPEQEGALEGQVIKNLTRQSKVSAHLITAYSWSQAIWTLGLLVTGLLTAGFVSGRRSRGA